jgi:hypothetical protein
MFEAVAVIRTHAHVGVHVETGDVCETGGWRLEAGGWRLEE